MAEREYYLEMSGITKTFPGVTALKDVALSVRSGELHGLVGENGAGKSTLMNVLGGLVCPDAGMIRINGKATAISGPNDAARQGIAFVHQESNLLDNLTVEQNVYLAREAVGVGGRLLHRSMAEEILRVGEELGYPLRPHARVGELNLAEQQSVEIVRALMQNPKILILDEPTAALDGDEVERLFRILDALKKQGVSIIYISHRLDEVVRLADRVTVLKDGCLVGCLDRTQITKDTLVSMMVGRVLEDIYPDRHYLKPGPERLRVEGLCVGSNVRDISFSVRAGEIVGLGGLEGQGQRAVVRAIFGEMPVRRGKITVNGLDVAGLSMRKRIRRGIGYVTHDRRGEGLVLPMSLLQNSSLAALFRLTGPLGLLRRRQERADVQAHLDTMQIKATSPDQPVGNLSGGNQQKVMLTRWLMTHPKILIIDEPTKGVDVGARMSVYRIIDQLTRQGLGILMLTSDMMELMGLSDRILVFYDGAVAREFQHHEATEEGIMRAASGLTEVGS